MVDLMRVITGKPEEELPDMLGPQRVVPSADDDPFAVTALTTAEPGLRPETVSAEGAIACDHRIDEGMWPADCLESARRFGHLDALLYPLLRGPVRTPQGVGVLQQVLGGFAVVEFEGLATVKRFKADTIRPIDGGRER